MLRVFAQVITYFIVGVNYGISACTYDCGLGVLPTDRPLNIAHRGSSGQLPEHTIMAYKLAVKQGADVIECDLAVTKDLKLVCTHEPFLNHSTDVASHEAFRGRVRTIYAGGYYNRNITDYFTIDFTLAELQTLKKVQTRAYRDQSYNMIYPVASFDDYVAVAQDPKNKKTIGIYPETKIPQIFNEFLKPYGKTMEDLLLESLKKHGYAKTEDPCFIQSFDINSLMYMSNKTKLRLVYLVEDTMSTEDMKKYSSFLYGIGPWKQAIVKIDPVTKRIACVTDFLERAHSFGYKVHPYTFRNEYQFLAYDYAADPYREYEKFMDLGVDGFFTDFPWSLTNYMELRGNVTKSCPNGSSTTYQCSWLVGILIAAVVLRIFN